MKTLWRARMDDGIGTIQKDDTRFAAHRPGGFLKRAPLDQLNTTIKGNLVRSPFQSGEYFPRIWRDGECPDPEEANLTNEWISSVRASRILSTRMRELFRCVEPNSSHNKVFGHEQRELLILACTEVESSWKAVLVANGAASTGKRLSTEDYVCLLAPMRLSNWAVSLSTHPGYGLITPFKSWDAKEPTKSLLWYHAYNSVKHDREQNFQQATFENVLQAMAGVFIMTVAQFGRSHLDRDTYFHVDEFRIEEEPAWKLDELYIPPLKDAFESANGWLGFECWTARMGGIPAPAEKSGKKGEKRPARKPGK